MASVLILPLHSVILVLLLFVLLYYKDCVMSAHAASVFSPASFATYNIGKVCNARDQHSAEKLVHAYCYFPC